MDTIVGAPKVTVLMPVYNGGAYLRLAIDSIIKQTFTDYELLIIDDGSTDQSAQIIQSYHDNRIRCIQHAANQGLIATLNEGIDLARGQYLARMDQDDIATPDRLFIQSHYLDSHPTCAVVGSTVTMINQPGQVIGEWSDDRQYTSAAAIRQHLPKANCVAHPTVMGRTALFKKYHYTEYQTNAEDYDLWLRLVADHQNIEKIVTPLLLYRVHHNSMTQRFGLPAGQWLTITTKGRFLRNSLHHGKMNNFIIQVAWQYSKDLVWWMLYGRRNRPDTLL